jgi:hypothetical protein
MKGGKEKMTEREFLEIKQRWEKAEEGSWYKKDVSKLLSEIMWLRDSLEWINEMQDMFYTERVELEFGYLKELPKDLQKYADLFTALFATVNDALAFEKPKETELPGKEF